MAFEVDAHAPLSVAVMEAPGLIAGVLLAKLMTKSSQTGLSAVPVSWRVLLHDVVFGKSVSCSDDYNQKSINIARSLEVKSCHVIYAYKRLC